MNITHKHVPDTLSQNLKAFQLQSFRSGKVAVVVLTSAKPSGPVRAVNN